MLLFETKFFLEAFQVGSAALNVLVLLRCHTQVLPSSDTTLKVGVGSRLKTATKIWAAMKIMQQNVPY